MTLKAVLFDFDMTLIDTSAALLRNVNMLARHFGKPQCSREKLMKVIGWNSRDFWLALLGDERPEYGEYYAKHCIPGEAELMVPAPGALKCVTELRARGVKVGCASNRTTPMRVIRAKGLEELMDCVVGADDVARPKPAPDVLLKGAELLGAEPEAVIYAGDTTIDVQAALSAGMRCAAVQTSTSGEELRRAGAWRVIPDLTHLTAQLEGEGLI
ncbi:MAG: HAD family hydrolase [Pyramidobacter sp.]|jgi:HAD superfamily hydrolase (TIGR01509 family)